jgi:hypothetical protein
MTGLKIITAPGSWMRMGGGTGTAPSTDERRTNDQGPTADYDDQAFDLLLLQ